MENIINYSQTFEELEKENQKLRQSMLKLVREMNNLQILNSCLMEILVEATQEVKE